VTDLALSGRIVQLVVTVRRFCCDAVPVRAPNLHRALRRRRTGTNGATHDEARLYCPHLGLALGGRPAASFAKRLMLPVSKDTLLRVVRRRSDRRLTRSGLSALTIGFGGAITDTPASSATWKVAGYRSAAGS